MQITFKVKLLFFVVVYVWKDKVLQCQNSDIVVNTINIELTD